MVAFERSLTLLSDTCILLCMHVGQYLLLRVFVFWNLSPQLAHSNGLLLIDPVLLCLLEQLDEQNFRSLSFESNSLLHCLHVKCFTYSGAEENRTLDL